MSRYINSAGYVKYTNGENNELKRELENFFFPNFFDKGWKPIIDITKEVWIGEIDRIDYFGLKDGLYTFIEIKNEFIRNKDIHQILRYWCLMKNPFVFYIICMGIDDRKKILEEKNIKIILIKDIDEINPEKVVYWM